MKPANILLVVILISFCTACGPRQVKGKAPVVSIATLTVADEKLGASFNIRNINDVAMDIEQIEITIRIREAELIRHLADLALSIDPNTTEEIVAEKIPEEFAQQLLDELESGSTGNLPFFLEGRIRTSQDGNTPFQYEGFLYPVPGRPGQYRSASSRAPEQR